MKTTKRLGVIGMPNGRENGFVFSQNIESHLVTVSTDSNLMTEKSNLGTQTITIQATERIGNVFGYLLSLFCRLKPLNPDFCSLSMDDDFAEITAVSDTSTQYYFNGNPVPDDMQVHISFICTNGAITANTSRFETIKDIAEGKSKYFGSHLAHAIQVPKIKNGLPSYTKNETINSILYTSGVAAGKDSKNVTDALNEVMGYIPIISAIMDHCDVESISLGLLKKVHFVIKGNAFKDINQMKRDNPEMFTKATNAVSVEHNAEKRWSGPLTSIYSQKSLSPYPEQPKIRLKHHNIKTHI